QAGSSFKAFVLLALLENGYVPDDRVDGHGPCEFPNPGGTPDPYEVENFGNSRGGTATVESQTLRSSNCAYVRLGQIVGIDRVVEVARRLGITTPLDPSIISTPLGTQEVLPIQMASAYGALANDGVLMEPFYIDRVEDRTGHVLFAHE